MKSLHHWLIFVAVAMLMPSGLAGQEEPGQAGVERLDDASQVASEEVAFFESRIRPVLVKHCYECHSVDSKTVQGGLRVDDRAALLAGGDSGPAIVPGEPEESLLLSALHYDSYEMPPAGKLSDRVLTDFAVWIRQGAVDPREAVTVTAKAIDFDSARQQWRYQVPRRSRAPIATQTWATGWSQTEVDTFVAAKLAEHQLQPNERASRATLIRRLSFDLLGLPPHPEQVRAFVADDRPDAYERLVDQYLASPEYGIRLARMWLDVMRYAEDQAHIVGNNQSLFYPNAHLYRSWVVEAFNADLPYDQFVRLQLAADQLYPNNREAQVALGFLGLGPKYYRRNSPEVMADEWEDRVDTVSRGLLGLTVACARCHDHKYDPISTEDYYALAGVFASTEMFNQPLHDGIEVDKSGQAKKPVESIHVVRDGKVRDLAVQIRGDASNLGEVVSRRYATVLAGEGELQFDEGSGRGDLAQAIASADNPLFSRVMVNRIWQLHFGEGLVRTPSNFGALGTPPSHPQLLDYLATGLVRAGWSLKWLQREIVLSAAYQQSSDIRAEANEIDAANRWLWRMARRRLSVEQWRDAVLVSSGQLSRQLTGESIDPGDPVHRQRTLFSRVSRLELHPMLAMFDFPDPNAHAASRAETTTPLQKLFLMNHPFMLHHAESLTKQLEQYETDEQRIEQLYWRVLGRRPRKQEVELTRGFVTQDVGESASDRWVQLVQILFASNEFYLLD